MAVTERGVNVAVGRLDVSAYTLPTDHAQIDRMLFEGGLEPEQGVLRPDRGRPGNGLELKRADAKRYAE